jgi:ATP-binding cassette, subfamily G (WHITE), member 2, PDR
MSSEEKHEYRPERTENFLGEDSKPFELIERPAMIPAESSADVEESNTMERTQTGRSTVERRFEPIHSGDRAELQRIASEFGGSVGLSRTQTRGSFALERMDTLYGIKLGDAVINPSSPEFDVYKWTRMLVMPRHPELLMY